MRVAGLSRRTLVIAFIVLYLSYFADAGCSRDYFAGIGWSPVGLQTMAYALGMLMVVIQGVRYIAADSAQDRGDVKKGLIYIVIGVLVVQGMMTLINWYCDMAGI